MRPQQQNRRMRGRNNNNNNNNNNRKGGPNPLTRSYESNGPDVKIRGNAQQIADKYTTLARDAQSSGDRVMAENYLQHAEHYNRIIAAAQAQMPIQNFQQNRDDFDDEDGEEREDFEGQGNFGGDQPQSNAGNGPQPVIEGTPAEVALNGESNGESQNQNRNGFRNRDGRNRDRNRDYQNRNNGNGDYSRRDQQRADQQQPSEESQPVQTSASQAEDIAGDSLPDFLTVGAQTTPVADAPAEEAPRRPRRPRRTAARQANDDAADNAPAKADSQPVAETFATTEE